MKQNHLMEALYNEYLIIKKVTTLKLYLFVKNVIYINQNLRALIMSNLSAEVLQTLGFKMSRDVLIDDGVSCEKNFGGLF